MLYVVFSITIIYVCTAYGHFDFGSASVAAKRRLENIYTSYQTLRPETIVTSPYEAMFFVYIQDTVGNYLTYDSTF